MNRRHRNKWKDPLQIKKKRYFSIGEKKISSKSAENLSTEQAKKQEIEVLKLKPQLASKKEKKN